MISRAMDNLDFVEAVMVLEEDVGIDIPSDDPEQCGSPRQMVDLLEHHRSNQRPTKKALRFNSKARVRRRRVRVGPPATRSQNLSR